MLVEGGTTHGVKRGRFSVVSTPCGRCGLRWELRGWVDAGFRPLVEILRGDPLFRHRCSCTATITFLVPPFVDRSSITVARTDRSGHPHDSCRRPAA